MFYKKSALSCTLFKRYHILESWNFTGEDHLSISISAFPPKKGKFLTDLMKLFSHVNNQGNPSSPLCDIKLPKKFVI